MYVHTFWSHMNGKGKNNILLPNSNTDVRLCMCVHLYLPRVRRFLFAMGWTFKNGFIRENTELLKYLWSFKLEALNSFWYLSWLYLFSLVLRASRLLGTLSASARQHSPANSARQVGSNQELTPPLFPTLYGITTIEKKPSYRKKGPKYLSYPLSYDQIQTKIILRIYDPKLLRWRTLAMNGYMTSWCEPFKFQFIY